MRVLLDECLPARLRREMPGHAHQTVPQAGWASVSNGKLLRLITDSGKFDIFVTVDKNLPHQQKVKNLPFAIVVLRACSNRLQDVRLCMPELLRRSPGFQILMFIFSPKLTERTAVFPKTRTSDPLVGIRLSYICLDLRAAGLRRAKNS